MPNRILPEFQDFLVSRSLAPAKNAPFYAHWVSKFFAFSNRNQDLSSNLKVQKFLNHLKSQKKTADWQIEQAQKALGLYFHHFLDTKTPVLSPGGPQKRSSIPPRFLVICVRPCASSIILTERNVPILSGLKGSWITLLM